MLHVDMACCCCSGLLLLLLLLSHASAETGVIAFGSAADVDS